MNEDIRRDLDEFISRPTYPALNPMILGAIDDERLEQAIADYLWGRAQALGVDVTRVLSHLDLAFSHVYATWITEAEVYNGGFNQYFFNSSGRLAPEAAEGYVTIGSPERALIVRTAMERVLGHSETLASAWSERTLEAFSESYKLEIFADLDEAFFAMDDVENASELRVAFIRAHPEAFTAS
jgi:hypothetical protein